MRVCYICGSSKEELRPYGERGQDICYTCMKSSKELEAEAYRQFTNQLTHCPGIPVIGLDVGPVPLDTVLGYKGGRPCN